MGNVNKKTSNNCFILAIFSAMVLLAYFSSQTMPMQPKSKTHQEPSNLEVELVFPNTSVENITTTSTTIEEVTSTVPDVTTTVAPIRRTTTTEPYTTPISSVEISGANGPPHNTTSLVGCISYYESSWGKDPNVFQFTQGTWEAYGGNGSPANASYSEQETIFWAAWNDDGEHHWAAQKGRCF